MSDRPGAGRDTKRRARFRPDALTAVLAATLVLAAACGGSSSSGSGSGSALPTLQDMTNRALAYAQCMRAHGIHNFPDPTVQDNAHAKGVGFHVPPGDQNLPQYKPAASACKKQSGFGVITPAQIQAAMANGLKFAECMRSHGISNYPDPVDKGNLIQIGPGPDSGINMNSARFEAARKACVSLLPNGGP
jgi:hypothetical protein